MTETINSWTLKPKQNQRRPEEWFREDGTRAFVLGSRLIWFIVVDYDGFRLYPNQKHIYTRPEECNQALRAKLADPNFLSAALNEGAEVAEAEANALHLAAKKKQENARNLGVAAMVEKP